MKLKLSLDMANQEQAKNIALNAAPFVDIIEIGTPLLYAHGINIIKDFKETFPGKEIFVDTKIVDRIEETLSVVAPANPNYISMLAGTNNSIIQNASKIAHSKKIKVALDLVDAYSMGQSAMDAQALDIDVIIFHGPHETTKLETIIEEWQIVKENTSVPIFIAGGINRKNINLVLELKPNGIVIGEAIAKAQDPAKEAEYFKSLIG